MGIKERIQKLKKAAIIGGTVGAAFLPTQKAQADETAFMSGMLFNQILNSAQNKKEETSNKEAIAAYDAFSKAVEKNITYPDFIPVKKDGSFDKEASFKLAEKFNLKEKLPKIMACYEVITDKNVDAEKKENALNELTSYFIQNNKTDQKMLKSFIEHFCDTASKESKKSKLPIPLAIAFTVGTLCAGAFLCKKTLKGIPPEFAVPFSVGTLAISLLGPSLLILNSCKTENDINNVFVKAHEIIYNTYKQEQIASRVFKALQTEQKENKGYAITDPNTAKQMFEIMKKNKTSSR